MKTGIILYIVGDEPANHKTDTNHLVNQLPLVAERIEVISRNTGHFDVHDAWWSLIAKGMKHILCVLAEYTKAGDLRLTGRSLRLCG